MWTVHQLRKALDAQQLRIKFKKVSHNSHGGIMNTALIKRPRRWLWDRTVCSITPADPEWEELELRRAWGALRKYQEIRDKQDERVCRGLAPRGDAGDITAPNHPWILS